MAYDITQLKSDLEGIGHGTTINQITNIDGMINRAARQILLDVDPQETKRILEIASPLFDQVYDYPLPADLKGNKIVDIRPQVHRSPNDQFSQTYNENFDLYKSRRGSPMFTINFNTAVKTVRIEKNLTVGVIINEANSITGNGTWTLGGDANTLAVDNVNFANSNGSLRFNTTGATGVAFIENSTMTAVDLTNQLNQGVEFPFFYLPTASNFTSVELRWGSSATDYYTRTVTVTQALTAFQNGWNLMAMNWDGATVVGAPNPASITYLRYTFNSTVGVAMNNLRINGVTSRLGTIYEIEYYSKFLFRDATTGAFQENVLANSDLINLDTETYNLLTNLCALYMAQQQQGADSSFDTSFFEKKYQDTLARYKALYKSELIKPSQMYYKRTTNNYRRWFGEGPQGGTST